ncbi:hypothetical protein H310_06228 [Aphanomyces invadans]|uniref:Uncharacterized protein n=1 Tax=Aphanomyces invadans TaxID=157072 RepID=A0A024U5T4_9STRA|nr:hypothetical protein H310_06228 [Aphanomyces invadans]ETW01585.1 hypothetical protein H310_06228 [Aphanomyces invadans]|eukprot:XP_008869433.1 hypothetical protein H310_06228 [Aphanomyces invadans]
MLAIAAIKPLFGRRPMKHNAAQDVADVHCIKPKFMDIGRGGRCGRHHGFVEMASLFQVSVGLHRVEKLCLGQVGHIWEAVVQTLEWMRKQLVMHEHQRIAKSRGWHRHHERHTHERREKQRARTSFPEMISLHAALNLQKVFVGRAVPRRCCRKWDMGSKGLDRDEMPHPRICKTLLSFGSSEFLPQLGVSTAQPSNICDG